MIKSFCQRNRREHPATLPDRQIDHPPLPNATTSRYDKPPSTPAATAAYLNQSLNGMGQVSGFSTSTPSFTVSGWSRSSPSARPVNSVVAHGGNTDFREVTEIARASLEGLSSVLRTRSGKVQRTIYGSVFLRSHRSQFVGRQNTEP